MMSVLCNMSATSFDGLTDVFKAMFLKAVHDQFTLSRAQISYLITDALGSYFRQIVLEEIQNSSTYFTFLYDEIQTPKVKKKLLIALRFWC